MAYQKQGSENSGEHEDSGEHKVSGELTSTVPTMIQQKKLSKPSNKKKNQYSKFPYSKI